MRAHEPLLGITFPRLLWRKPVLLQMDSGYRGAALARRYGKRWPQVFAKVAADRSFEIFGSDNDREWYSVSTWRPASSPKEMSRPVRNVGFRELVRDRMRDAIAQLNKEPSRSAAAWHLKRQGLTRDPIIKTMHELGWEDVTRNTVGDHLKYGHQLEDDGVACPFDAFL